MKKYVLMFNEIDKTNLNQVGGKGANLGELFGISGIQAPNGFCVTTQAYKEITESNAELESLFEQLYPLKADDTEKIRELGAKIRTVIEGIAIPKGIADEVIENLILLGENNAYAVRSSATAEDLPTASFAGQQDTYLNVIGKESMLNHISKCWASLYTDRAISYRIQNGFDHRKVFLSVVIQLMIFPEAAGIMFTADPITSNRKIVSIDASFGLGEAMVSGTVNSDNYTVRQGVIIDKKISTKTLAVYALKEGGTEERKIESQRQNDQALTDEQIIKLENIGRLMEAYFSLPQDIEWGLYQNELYIVQSRPITTLYPLPEKQDGENRVYMSFGHQQMMTDAMKPLGLSCFQYSAGDGTLMAEAGGRLFMDLSHDLAPVTGRAVAVEAMGKVDPLIDSGLRNLAKRKDFMNSLARGKKFLSMGSGYFSWDLVKQFMKVYRSNDPTIVPALIEKNETAIAELDKKFATLSGEELFDAADAELKQIVKIIAEPQGMASVWTGTLAVSWVNKKVEKWLGDKGAADTLMQSAPNSIANEMGLGLLDVSDVVRQYPEVMEYFQNPQGEGADAFFNALSKLEGGVAVSEAMQKYLAKFGVRCPGEIDLTRPRWAEEPSALAPLILSNISNFSPGARVELYEQGLKDAENKRQDILNRLSGMAGGKSKAKKTEKNISRLRNFIGYREYPKYVMVSRYWIIKKALLHEAEKLVASGAIQEREDIFFLTFEELREVSRTMKLDYDIILKRKDDFELFQKLTPPRLMTSEGEIIPGEYKSGNAPKGALIGIAASSGVVEGRARVILRLEDAKFSKGDILVTTFTDPSWTPAFVSISGLVAEVGGVMTHGSVVAREYGIPAVVGVENATKKIKDGQRIRINGTEGYVEILPD